MAVRTDTYDVAVVGFGPVGQMAAIMLAARGHRVGVFERRPELYALPRAVHYDHEIARMFQAVGVAGDLEPIVEPATLYEWRNAAGETLLLLDWRGHGPSGWPVGTMFAQPELEAVLARRADSFPNVTVRQGWDVTSIDDTGDDVALELARMHRVNGRLEPAGDTASVRARYVIGCDGAGSTVREVMGVDNHDLGFKFDWLILDTIPSDPGLLAGVNRQICDPARPTTVVSGGPGRRRWEWMLLAGESPETIDTETFAWTQLARQGLGRDDLTLERVAIYTFGARWAEQWRKGRLLLAGDAAHLIPPFAGQGMCSGLRDVATLAWQLDLVLTGKAPADLLDAYAVERQAHLQHAIMTSVELGRVICVSDPAEAAARDDQMLAAVANPQLAPPPPPEPRLGPGVIVADDPAAGLLFPQGRVAVDGRIGRFDDLVGRGFVMYLHAAEAPDDSRLDMLHALGGRAVHVSADLDVDGTYRDWFTTNNAGAVLVRPDNYVFGTVPVGGSVAPLLADLDQRLTAAPVTR